VISLTIKDVNNDGKPDIITANQNASTVSVLLNTSAIGAGTPTFSAKTDFVAGTFANGISIADLNGDGKPDMVTPNFSAASVSVFFNTTASGAATPSFSAKTDFATGNSPTSVTIRDINLDGKLDLIVSNGASTSVSVLLNTTTTNSATPTFGAKTDFSTLNAPRYVTVDDINGDGLPDIAAANQNSNSVSVMLNTTTPGASTPTFTAKVNLSTGISSSPYSVGIGDFNGDGKPDIVSANSGVSKFSVFINITPLGVSSSAFAAKTDFGTNAGPAGIIPIDINLDGLPDMIYGNSNAANITIRLNNTTPGAATQSFATGTDFTTPIQPFRLCSADFNLDGKPDFAFSTFGSTLNIFLNTTTPGASTPTLSSVTTLSASSNGVAGICSADFNLDGKPDLASSVGTASNIAITLNTTTPGASTPTFSAITEIAAGLNSFGICSADFNGDGKPDIACANQSPGTISVYFNTTTPGASTPSFSAKTDFTTASSPNMIVAVDINGDGKPDLACSCQSSGGFISVLLNNTTTGSATPSFSTKTDFATGTNCYGIAAGDLNGDGLQDLASVNYGGNTLSYFLNTTTSGASTPTFAARQNLTTNSSPRGMCIGDFNSDGKKDLVCSNLLNGNFSVFLNTTPIPLPVELSSFTSSVKGNDVTLNWSTVQEQNNKGFEIERSVFGEGWKKVGYVEGNGTINHIQNYTFTERGLSTGSYQYRLKQIDYNGNFEYHELTSEVIIGVPGKFALAQNYPNPFNPSTVISYQLPVAGFVSMKIFDISGREVASLVNGVKEAGYYSITFDAKSLSSGTYFYKLTTDKFSDVKKMVVIK